MKYRKLRIAWSVAWGIVCLLLVALWVRSYFYYFRVDGWDGKDLIIVSAQRGRMHFIRWPLVTAESRQWNYFFHRDLFGGLVSEGDELDAYAARAELSNGYSLSIPFLYPILLAGFLAALPLFAIRYSLRTLFIAMTLAAVGLGLIVLL